MDKFLVVFKTTRNSTVPVKFMSGVIEGHDGIVKRFRHSSDAKEAMQFSEATAKGWVSRLKNRYHVGMVPVTTVREMGLL